MAHFFLEPILEHLKAKRPLLTILGPTASGKTGFSIQLALSLRRHGMEVEVINADSRQLYRKLDIGTAKITNEEMEGVPHHLLGVLDPRDEVTVGWYKEEAEKTIEDILKRGNVPMLVGGSMLYISAIIDGLTLLPSADPAVHRKLLKEYEEDQGASLYRRLQKIDPESARGIHPRNKPYLIRALEIYESLGLKASRAKRKTACPYDLLLLGITWPREELKERIGRRTGALLHGGWIEEVQRLLQEGYILGDPGMKSHGYREIMGYLQEAHPKTLEELLMRITVRTCQYAKRQMTWWRGDERIAWFTPEVMEGIVETVAPSQATS